MVVSKRHVPSFEGLNEDEILDINKVLKQIMTALKSILKPAGFNVGMNLGKVAGAGIDKHMHIHVVPRWLGDTNFMPVLSDAKIISQSLNELYAKLADALE
jgi:ATP adenylyltransferase